MEKDSLRKWLDGTMSAEEKAAFESTDEFKKLQRILESSKNLKAPEYDVEKELSKINKRKSPEGKIIKMYDNKVLMKLAASIIIFFSIYWFFLRSGDEKFSTIAGEKMELVLPDSSEVIMNAFSNLTYSKRKWKKKRIVELEGEAFFKVMKGSSFEVNTDLGVVSVLGTQFNVKQREGLFEVTCFEGKVKVVNAEHETILIPSQSVRIYQGKVTNEKTQLSDLPNWVSNKSEFASLPYIEVIREFERQYGAEVELNQLDTNQLFTGGFTHTDLESALKSVSLPLNATYEILDQQHIRIIGEKD